MVDVAKLDCFLSSLELNITYGSSCFSVVSKVDKMPFVQLFTIFDEVVNIAVTSAIQVGVSIGSKGVNSSLVWSNEQ